MSILSDALHQAIASDIDGEKKSTQEYVNTLVTEKKLDLAISKANAVENVAARLNAAKADNADPSVLQAYKAIQESLVKL